jgi:hypothetical protein
MPSVADDLRRMLCDRLRAMSPADRLALTASLAEWDLDLFCGAQHMARDAARRLLVSRRHAGRRPSRVMEAEPA